MPHPPRVSLERSRTAPLCVNDPKLAQSCYQVESQRGGGSGLVCGQLAPIPPSVWPEDEMVDDAGIEPRTSTWMSVATECRRAPLRRRRVRLQEGCKTPDASTPTRGPTVRALTKTATRPPFRASLRCTVAAVVLVLISERPRRHSAAQPDRHRLGGSVRRIRSVCSSCSRSCCCWRPPRRWRRLALGTSLTESGTQLRPA